ncbi:MAG: phosphatidylglycerophosphatase A [Porticoccaceae bacterium]
MSPDTQPTLDRLLHDPVLLVAFGFGSGLAPRAPGTCGSLAALALSPLLLWLPAPLAWGFLAIAVIAGIFICGSAVSRLGVADHPGIVWDEFAGLWLALLLAPSGWLFWAGAFVLFRIFDIVKPWPIRWLDRRCAGGFGVMIDDLAAGLATGAVLQLPGVLR